VVKVFAELARVGYNESVAIEIFPLLFKEGLGGGCSHNKLLIKDIILN
jgi:hypothetical protein